jgi:hypothetical protein
MQTQFNFDVITPQNNRQSEEILVNNEDDFKKQADRIYAVLLTGRKLTVREMMIEMNIGDPRARIRDIRKKFEVKDNLREGRFKEYFLNIH